MKRPPIVSIIIAALLAFFIIVIGLLSSVVTIVLPPAITPYLRFSLPLLGIITLAYVGLTIWQTWRQSTSDDSAELTKSEHYRQSIEKSNRQRMLAKVRAYWITGVLEESLHGEIIELGLHEQPEAARLELQELDLPARELPSGTHITKVYDDAAGELLILGEPGSGKTTVMLELARDLLERAEKDDSYLIPVIFNLSSWALKRKALADWLIDELNIKYQVPRKLGQSWVNDDQILPLLDGLDEVASDARSECIDAINSYRKEHGIVSTVVCCRRSEYMALIKHVSLRNAITIQPLTSEQIDDYLSSAGGQLAAVRIVLRDDPDLQEMAASPLMLNILTLAYYGMSVESFLSEDPLEKQRKVFANYIKRMLQRRGTETSYTSQQTMRWLIWLAQKLTQLNETEFYIERIQPSWLTNTLSFKLYRGILAGLIGGLLGGLLVWSILGLSLGLLALVFCLLSCGLVFGLFGTLIGKIPSGLAIGMIFGLIFGLLGELSNERLGGLLGNGLAGMAIGGVIGYQFNNIIESIENKIVPAETTNFSWLALWKNMYLIFISPTAIVISLIYSIIIGFISGLQRGELFDLKSTLLIFLTFMIIFSIVAGFLGGMSLQIMDKRNLVKPNQGILNSVRYGVHFGILLTFVSVVLCILLLDLNLLPHTNITPIVVIPIILFAFLLLALLTGGSAGLSHYLLRLLLRSAGYAPMNYPRFLDYADDCILLRKVGGGYIFVHRLLLDYFASLNSPSISQKAEVNRR